MSSLQVTYSGIDFGNASRRVPQSGIGSDDDWPWRSFLELSALPTAASCARLHTRAVLAEWGMADLAEDAELAVSELTANAFLASARSGGSPGLVRLWLLADEGRLVLVVWDDSRQPPVRSHAPAFAEHGRGLQIVEAVSSAWGWFGRPDEGGKCVWAEFRR